MKVVFPSEMVGLVSRFKPGGGLPFHVEIDGKFPEVVVCGAEILPPLPVDVEIADLIADGDEFGISSDGGGLEQVDDDAPVDADLGMVLVVDSLSFEVVVMLDFEEVVIDAGIQIKRNVVRIVLVS